nr:fimbrial protein [uncultured Moellerella sp.]
MNKIIIFCFLFFVLIPFHIKSEEIYQTKIHIFGTLLGHACSVEQTEIFVEFGNVTNKDLYFHSRTPSIPFSLEIKGCDLDFDNDAIVSFIGNESNHLSLQGFLDIDDSSQASGIGIGIENADGKFLPLREESSKFNINATDMTLNFNAFIQADSEAIKNKSILLGEFTATSIFVIEYE